MLWLKSKPKIRIYILIWMVVFYISGCSNKTLPMKLYLECPYNEFNAESMTEFEFIGESSIFDSSVCVYLEDSVEVTTHLIGLEKADYPEEIERSFEELTKDLPGEPIEDSAIYKIKLDFHGVNVEKTNRLIELAAKNGLETLVLGFDSEFAITRVYFVAPVNGNGIFIKLSSSKYNYLLNKQ